MCSNINTFLTFTVVSNKWGATLSWDIKNLFESILTRRELLSLSLSLSELCTLKLSSLIKTLLFQHALSRVGGVIFSDTSQRWTGTTNELDALWKRAVAGSGVLAWPRLAAVTSLTHPRMFHYFHASIDDFLFVQMVDVTRLVVANKPAVVEVMRPWIQCALTVDCIMPIGT